MIGTFFQQQFVRTDCRRPFVGLSLSAGALAAQQVPSPRFQFHAPSRRERRPTARGRSRDRGGEGARAAPAGAAGPRRRAHRRCCLSGRLSAGVELQVDPASGMRIRIVPRASLELELFIAVCRLERPAVLKSDGTNVREGLVRYGSALPYPEGGAQGCVAFHGVVSPCIAAGATGKRSLLRDCAVRTSGG